MLAANLRLGLALLAGVAIGAMTTAFLVRAKQRTFTFDPKLLGTWKPSLESNMRLVIGYETYMIMQDGLPQNVASSCSAEGGIFAFEVSGVEGEMTTQRTAYTLSADHLRLSFSTRKNLPFSGSEFTRIGDVQY